jgi:hypothetical protein
MINYDNGARGTLSPPTLNDIEGINSNDSLTFNIPNVLNFNAVDTNYNGGSYNITVQGLSINSDIINIESNNSINFNNAIVLPSKTTVEIINSISAIVGTCIFCSTINQLVFYQVSPITGTVLGWYNSTGSIKL